MQNIFARVEVKIAEGVSSTAKRLLRSLIQFFVFLGAREAKLSAPFLLGIVKNYLFFVGNAKGINSNEKSNKQLCHFICHSGN